MPLSIAVLASGRGSNMASLLDACRAGLVDGRVTLLVTDQPGAACIEKAQAAGVPAILAHPKRPGERRAAYDERLAACLRDEGPDLIVLAGFMRILTAPLCEAFEGRIINIHPALLPSFKGAHGIRDTLAAGAKLAGCSTHFVTADLDGGPIILQAALAVQEGEDEERLADRVLRLEHQVLPRTVQLIAEGRVEVEGARTHIAAGPSWRDKLDLVEGALYSEGF